MKHDRASSTARLIAAATVMRERQRVAGGRPPAGAAGWCERFLSTNLADRVLLASARSPLGRAAWQVAESFFLRGVVSHWMRRKREIDRLARTAAAGGFEQLVVIGAGLDTLAFRLGAEQVFKSILSADHSATLEVVRASMSSSSEGPTDSVIADSSVNLLSIDLVSDDASVVLGGSSAFKTDLATLFVIEGVLMYLPEAKVAQVVRSLAALPVPRGRLIASWMRAEPAESIGFHNQSRLVDAWLRRIQEPMLWASTPERLPEFLSRQGWRNAKLINLADPDPTCEAGELGLSSERLVVAQR